MRFRSNLILVGLMSLLVGAFVLAGCSSDNDSTPQTPTVSFAERMLPTATAQVNEQLDSVIARLDAGLTVATVVEDQGEDDRNFSPGADTVATADDWTVILLTDLQSSIGALTIVDSIQYLNNDSPQSSPVDADQVVYRHYYSRSASDTTVTSKDLVVRSDLSFDGTDGTQATIDGSVTSVIHDKVVTNDSTVWHDWDIDATVTAFRVAKAGQTWGEGCPITGTAQISVEFTYQKNSSAPVSTSWDYTIVFTNGSITANISSGPEFSSSYQHTVCNP